MKEYELKILGIKPTEARKRLLHLGAKKTGHFHYKRIIFPLKGKKGENRWFRLRSDGKKHVLTLKINVGHSISDTQEYEVAVQDFNKCAKLLCSAFQDRYYEENDRELYSLEGAEITIDKWPYIPYLAEIEAHSAKKVKEMYKKLKISGKPFGNVPAGEVYKHYGLDVREMAKKNEKKLRAIISGRAHAG